MSDPVRRIVHSDFLLFHTTVHILKGYPCVFEVGLHDAHNSVNFMGEKNQPFAFNEQNEE